MDFFEDRFGGRCPCEGFAILVVMGNEMVDFRDEFFDRAERAAADRLIGDCGKESLNEIEPGTVSRREMHMPTRSGRQPRLDLGMFVRGIVVHDHVDVQIGGNGLVNAAQERQKFLMPMTGFAFG